MVLFKGDARSLHYSSFGASLCTIEVFEAAGAGKFIA